MVLPLPDQKLWRWMLPAAPQPLTQLPNQHMHRASQDPTSH